LGGALKDGDVKNDRNKFILCAIFFIVLAAITFRCVWGADLLFSASDMSIGRLAAKKNVLPESFAGVFSPTAVMGSNGFGFSLFNILLTLLPVTVFANAFYGLVLVSGSLFMVWFLRLWNRSWTASVFGAVIAFWFNSIMLAAGGHAYKMEVLAFLVLSLCLVEKAIRSTTIRAAAGFSIFAGLSVGIMMIEQQDVALLAGLFVGPYAVFRLVQVHGKSIARWLCILLPIGVVALLLSGSTVLKSYERNIAGAASVQKGQGEQKWNYITQWSMVPSEWPDLIASGWGGWGSNRPDGPYWGKIGQSPEWESTGKGFRNFKITSKYLGIIPFLLGIYGFIESLRCRKNGDGSAMLFWSVAGILGLWLAFGKYSILYKLFYHFPLVGNIRDQSKFLDLFQICLGIVAAYGLDGLLLANKKDKAAKILWISSAVCAGLMGLAGLRYLVSPAGKIAEFKAMGFAGYADVMVANMSNAWLHAAVLALACAGLVIVLWKGLKQSRWVGIAFIAVLAVDSLLLTSHYFHSSNIAELKKGNALVNYLKQNQGNERIFFMDQGGIYNQWLASDGPFHGLNIFNIWQMPRMPVEYKEYLGKVGRNQMRLWELSSIKYVAAPAEIMQQLSQNPELGMLFKPVLNYTVPTAQGMRNDVLLEFNGSIPRMALFDGWDVLPLDQHCEMLASQQHNPRTTVLVPSAFDLAPQKSEIKFQPLEAIITQRTATVDVQTERPAILRFSQRYSPGWRVLIDGKDAEVLKVDYLCLGVQVPPGEHRIVFMPPSGIGNAGKILAVFIVSAGLGITLVMRGKKIS
jgi:hypothetical protein